MRSFDRYRAVWCHLKNCLVSSWQNILIETSGLMTSLYSDQETREHLHVRWQSRLAEVWSHLEFSELFYNVHYKYYTTQMPFLWRSALKPVATPHSSFGSLVHLWIRRHPYDDNDLKLVTNPYYLLSTIFAPMYQVDTLHLIYRTPYEVNNTSSILMESLENTGCLTFWNPS